MRDLPKNEVFSELDMRQINGVCKHFGGVDTKEPRIQINEDGSVILDLFLGYKFYVARKERSTPRVFRSLKGQRTEMYICNGYQVFIYTDGECVSDHWAATVEDMLTYMFSVMVNHVAVNVGQSESMAMAFSESDR